MPVLSDSDGYLTLRVAVRPRSGRDEIAGVRGDELVVRLSVPPVEGRANQALCRLIAKAVGTAPTNVTLVRGVRGRSKTLALRGVSLPVAASRLGL